MKILKSIGAVAAGFIAVFVLSVGTDYVLQKIGVYPPTGILTTWMLGLALAYRTVYPILGGYITATLAPERPMLHVKILAVIGTLMAVLGTIAAWNLSDHWYPIALIILAFPSVWYGGKLKQA